MDCYFSVDVEADGPIPGPYSMLSIGLAVAGTFDGRTFLRADPTAVTFYAELAPISDEFDPQALNVSGLDRERLRREGQDPAEAMSEIDQWVKRSSAGAKPVFAAYPLGFDWMFAYWYFRRFCPAGSPFGFSSFLDMKTFYAARSSSTVGRSTKRFMPKSLMSNRRHTHNALDDAIEQADLLANLFEWGGSSAPA